MGPIDLDVGDVAGPVVVIALVFLAMAVLVLVVALVLLGGVTATLTRIRRSADDEEP